MKVAVALHNKCNISYLSKTVPVEYPQLSSEAVLSKLTGAVEF